MTKVKSLLKRAERELSDENAIIVSNYLKEKKKQIRDCQKTLNALKSQLKEALEQDVDDFAEKLEDVSRCY